MMSNWIYLTKKSIPTDILEGEWEIETLLDRGNGEEWIRQNTDALTTLAFVNSESEKIRIRRPQPKEPTHTEIMTKWWLDSDGKDWIRVTYYAPSQRSPYQWITPGCGDLYSSVSSEWFIGRESSDVPPEG